MPEKKTMTFGRYLRAVRQDQGIDLKTVSSRTRIGMDILQSIEAEEHSRLPAEVFVKGFLRAYAKVVGADGDEAVRRYLQNRHLLEATIQAETDRRRVSSRFWPRLLAILGGFVVIVVLSLVAAPRPGPEPGPAPEMPAVVHGAAETPVAPQNPVPAEGPPTGVSASTVGEPAAVPVVAPVPVVDRTTDAPVPPRDGHLLAITAIEETWIKVIVDNLAAREVTLRPGDRLELEARNGFNLLIGNAGGIAATFDGKAMPVLGKSSQVVSLQLP
ncbi:MAG: DUF4115 domain-containing protein [Desulfobacterales bacterium]|nr:DUF4115 domain-containing protein [Desulfobacterales bacterium]